MVDNYPATFRGLVSGIPMAGGLGPVGQRVLDMLWNSVTKLNVGSNVDDSKGVDALNFATSGIQVFF